MVHVPGDHAAVDDLGRLVDLAPERLDLYLARGNLLDARDVVGREVVADAVALVGGDKTSLGNHWYPPHIAEAQSRLDQYCRQYPELTPIVKRGNR